MPATPARKKTDKAEAFDAAFNDLKKVLAKHAPKLHVAKDSDAWYYLETKSLSYRGKRQCFGAVAKMKSQVSFYLMGIYLEPKLAAGMSSELQKRRQGKSCFNFQRRDPALFKELAALTKRSYEHFRDHALL